MAIQPDLWKGRTELSLPDNTEPRNKHLACVFFLRKPERLQHNSAACPFQLQYIFVIQ